MHGAMNRRDLGAVFIAATCSVVADAAAFGAIPPGDLCKSLPELGARQVHALLIGHPVAPVSLDLPRLQSVSQDVVRMHEFLSVLAPSSVHVLAKLGEVERELHPEIAVERPTLAKLGAAVDAIARAI